MLRLLPLLCFAASAASAASIQFTSLPATYQNATYYGFAPATVEGSPNQLLICDDFNHETYMPSGKMDFRVSTLTGKNILQYARFVDVLNWSSSVLKYEEAAVLVDGLSNLPAGSPGSATADYQSALWHLFAPQAPASSTALLLLNQAAATVQSGVGLEDALYSRLRVYTPTSAYGSNQEFLQLLADPDGHDSMATPEPATWGMMIAGAMLIGMSCGSNWFRKRLAARRYATWGSSLRAPGR